MESWTVGLIVTGEMVCDGCGKAMKHPERYGYVSEEDKPPQRLCADCSRARGYLNTRIDDKGQEVDTFL